MPVNELRRIGIVVNIDNDALPFLEAQQRSGELAVIERRRNNVVGCKFNKTCSDS